MHTTATNALSGLQIEPNHCIFLVRQIFVNARAHTHKLIFNHAKDCHDHDSSLAISACVSQLISMKRSNGSLDKDTKPIRKRRKNKIVMAKANSTMAEGY